MSIEHRSCPECDAPWRDTVKLSETLSDAGYVHTDVTHQCLECKATWTHGHPDGETSNPDLVCPVCSDILLVHKFDWPPESTRDVHFKCPTCFYWTNHVRLIDLENGEAAVGYPAITGDLPGETDG